MQRATSRRSIWLITTFTAALAAASLTLAAPASKSPAPAATEPVSNVGHLGRRPAASQPTTQPSSKQVMQSLLKQRPPSAVIKPNKAPTVEYVPGRTESAPGAGKLNPDILGVAPGEKPPHLLPEGTFIINRRGRMIRSKDGSRELFAFQADSQKAPEAPMILQACRKLESMEKIVTQRGNSVVFILSGQVHTYRGANYLMPTMIKVAPPRNNLGH